MILILLILVLDQSLALAKPEQVKPTFNTKIPEANQEVKIFWATYSFLTKGNQAMFLSVLLPPYLGARKPKRSKSRTPKFHTPGLDKVEEILF